MQRFKSVVLFFFLLSMVALGGCQKDVVHQRSMAELNQKAQAMMQAGDYAGAVARLEAAHDLQPEEVNTIYNLGIAYQMQGNYDKAIEAFNQVLDKPGLDKSELNKALAITYEAKGDKLETDAAALADDPKADKSQEGTMKQSAEEAYRLALGHYQEALNGAKNPGEIEKQIEALNAKLAGEAQPPG